MKDADGVFMENYWQFSKVWKKVDGISQPLSKYQPDRVRWAYHGETHIEDNKEDNKEKDKIKLTKEYWAWRKKGMDHNRWVRYPNGWNIAKLYVL